jgi:hypothetical protein
MSGLGPWELEEAALQAAAKANRPTVTRTVNLTPTLDDFVRVVAFHENKLKSTVLLELIENGLVARKMAGMPTTTDDYIAHRRGK